MTVCEKKGPPSLSEATNTLFREKQVSRDLGELAHLVLLHQVYREIDQVSQYQRRQLFTWIPRPDYQNNTSAENDGDGTSLVRNFRNAALDCVDVLHWAAMAKVASLSGAEHPMVLHLHFSRVVLLAPRTALMTLAKSVAASQHLLKDQHPTTTKELAAAAEREISEWVLRDEVSPKKKKKSCRSLWVACIVSNLNFLVTVQSQAGCAALRLFNLAHPPVLVVGILRTCRGFLCNAYNMGVRLLYAAKQ